MDRDARERLRGDPQQGSRKRKEQDADEEAQHAAYSSM
jgi:hypothetical protein